MATPAWLAQSHNESRGGPVAYLTAETPESNEYWTSWDFSVNPGNYRLELVYTDSARLNYFVVGTVPNENQPEPIQIAHRFGELVSRNVTDRVQGAHLPANESMSTSNIDFTISSPNQVLRVEGFFVKEGNNMGAPRLPAILTEWVFITPGQFGYGNFIRYRSNRARNFGDQRASLIKRTYETESILFSAEDGVDGDFNDLIARLKPI